MSNPSGTDPDDSDRPADESVEPAEPAKPTADNTNDEPTLTSIVSSERRYTAPGFDAGSTQIIHHAPEPETEIISTPTEVLSLTDPPPRTAPQEILPRDGVTPPVPEVARRRRSWVITVVLVVAAIVAAAIVGTILLTRDNSPKVSQEDQVRSTIQNFDQAVQKGDLATLRGITCGQTRDGYVAYDDRAWAETHMRVEAAKQYPVVASVDEVVVNGDHAEANVTSFMAYDPATRSTRSFDLQFRDNQWKICQAN